MFQGFKNSIFWMGVSIRTGYSCSNVSTWVWGSPFLLLVSLKNIVQLTIFCFMLSRFKFVLLGTNGELLHFTVTELTILLNVSFLIMEFV